MIPSQFFQVYFNDKLWMGTLQKERDKIKTIHKMCIMKKCHLIDLNNTTPTCVWLYGTLEIGVRDTPRETFCTTGFGLNTWFFFVGKFLTFGKYYLNIAKSSKIRAYISGHKYAYQIFTLCTWHVICQCKKSMFAQHKHFWQKNVSQVKTGFGWFFMPRVNQASCRKQHYFCFDWLINFPAIPNGSK